MTGEPESPPESPPENPPEKAASRVSRRPWLRNAAFLAGCLLTLALIAGGFWERETLATPQSFRARDFARDDFTSVIARLDAAMADGWRAAGHTPAAAAPPTTVARRLSLALTGTIPSLEEIRALDAQPAGSRVQWWLSRLFEDRRYADYFAERFARAFVGVETGPFLVYRRHRLVSWLSDRIHENRPYDELVRNLIDSHGIWTSEPEVNFITVSVAQNNPDKKGPDEVKLAGRVARAFLGLRIDCMACHDDKFGDRWKQEDFHQLAAFFGGSEMSLSGVRDNAKVSYEYRFNGQRDAQTVLPAVPFDEELLPAQGSIRERLARWVTHPGNRAFARAGVNRAWALLCNKPLVEPIDDIPLEGPWPPAMEILAQDFIAHGFDFQRLIRVIAAGRAFQLESLPAEPDAPAGAATGESWAAFPLTRLRPEQVAGSVIQASSLETIDGSAHILKRFIRFQQQGDFVKRYGDLGEDEFADQGGTIPQRLLMMNGEFVRKRTEQDLVFNAASRIGTLAPDDGTAVETAYLAVFSRAPTPEERDHFTARLAGTKGGARARAMEDLYWALMNATEFSWNH